MSAKKRDKKGRWRYRVVSFRASDEEVKAINEIVALSGLTKSDYIIEKLIKREITVTGNPRVFKALKTTMENIYTELVRLKTAGEVSDEFLETVELVAKIYSDSLNPKERNI